MGFIAISLPIVSSGPYLYLMTLICSSDSSTLLFLIDSFKPLRLFSTLYKILIIISSQPPL